MPQVEASNNTPDAGSEKALSNPNSPESIARKAKQSEAQSSEDQRYDAPPPEKSPFQDYVIVWEDEQKKSREISSAIFLTLGVLLFLYKAAPDRF